MKYISFHNILVQVQVITHHRLMKCMKENNHSSMGGNVASPEK